MTDFGKAFCALILVMIICAGLSAIKSSIHEQVKTGCEQQK